MNFSGQSVLVTGASSGTGAQMAKAFADLGAQVTISGRREAVLQEVVAHAPDKMNYVTGDVSSEADVKAMFEKNGPYQIVIANAGIAAGVPLKSMTLDHWNEVMAINATGVFLTLREALHQMSAGGRMIIISSILGKYGEPYASAYAASKHATLGFMKSIAKEVAKLDITVNAICPAYIDTDMTERTLDNIVKKTGLSREDALAELTKHNPQGKLITCEEVTHTALYLASPGASSVNGQEILLSGGGYS